MAWRRSRKQFALVGLSCNLGEGVALLRPHVPPGPILIPTASPCTCRCGPHAFRVGGLPDENKPQNILEEIVWWGSETAGAAA